MQLSRKSDSDHVGPHNNTSEEHKTSSSPKLALIGGIIGAIAIGIYILTAVYPSSLFSQVQDQDQAMQQPVLFNAHPVVPASPLKTSSVRMFDKTNEVWTRVFRGMGKTYARPALQLFEDTVAAQGCGYALPVAGPFYCVQDKVIYLDLGFFEAVEKRNPSVADLTEAYLVGRQAGHHVQDLLGITAKVQEARNRLSPEDYQKLSEKMEYQADFYAGIWLRSAYKKHTELSDLELAVSIATQTSADLATKTDRILPETFTFTAISEHASWFYKGYTSDGDMKLGNIFKDGDLQ